MEDNNIESFFEALLKEEDEQKLLHLLDQNEKFERVLELFLLNKEELND